MKQEHDEKMADLARREEEAKKQVHFTIRFLQLESISSKSRLQLGNKCIENGWQPWNDELIIYKSPMKNFRLLTI